MSHKHAIPKHGSDKSVSASIWSKANIPRHFNEEGSYSTKPYICMGKLGLLVESPFFFLEVLACLINRASRTRGSVDLGESVILALGAHALLEDGLRLVDLELGFEVIQVVRVSTTVGVTTFIGKIELLINDLLTSSAPGYIH